MGYIFIDLQKHSELNLIKIKKTTMVHLYKTFSQITLLWQLEQNYNRKKLILPEHIKRITEVHITLS